MFKSLTFIALRLPSGKFPKILTCQTCDHRFDDEHGIIERFTAFAKEARGRFRIKIVHAEDEEALLEAANHPEDAIRGEARAAYLAIDVAVGFPHNCVICHKLCGPHNHAAFAVILPGLLGDDPRTGIAGAVCTSCRPSISDEELRRMASEQACDILDLFRPAKGCDPANVWNRRPRS